MTLDAPAQELLVSASTSIETLRSGLVEGLSPYRPKPGAKLTRLVIVWREALRHRLVDLSSASLDFFTQERLVPACTLARSFYETVAQLYYFHKKLAAARNVDDLNELTDFLAKGAWGSKDGTTDHEAIQVLTAIKHLDKEFTGFRNEYFHLCEYAHPNMKGGLGAYTKIDTHDYTVALGKNPEGLPVSAFGLGALDIALVISIEVLDRHHRAEAELEKIVEQYANNLFVD